LATVSTFSAGLVFSGQSLASGIFGRGGQSLFCSHTQATKMRTLPTKNTSVFFCMIARALPAREIPSRTKV
jgi:hypothetical protein